MHPTEPPITNGQPLIKGAVLPDLIIRQPASTKETRAIVQASLLLDIPCGATNQDDLAGQPDLRLALPVGDVNYLRAAMAAAGAREPENLSYHPALRHMLFREIRFTHAGNVLGRMFIKPARTKAFTGFVFDTLADPARMNAHDREQYDAFMDCPPSEPVWVSEVVDFVSEWRYYVLAGKIIGAARYDQEGADSAPAPDPATAVAAARAMADAGFDTFALDLGVLSTGETALVEVNDAWAIGLYGRALDARLYLHMLWRRWQQITGTA